MQPHNPKQALKLSQQLGPFGFLRHSHRLTPQSPATMPGRTLGVGFGGGWVAARLVLGVFDVLPIGVVKECGGVVEDEDEVEVEVGDEEELLGRVWPRDDDDDNDDELVRELETVEVMRVELELGFVDALKLLEVAELEPPMLRVLDELTI